VTRGALTNSGALEVHENVVLTTAPASIDHTGTFNVDTVDFGLATARAGGQHGTVGGVLSSPTLNIATLISARRPRVTAAGFVSLGDINLTGSGTKQATLNYLVPVPSPGTITTKLILRATRCSSLPAAASPASPALAPCRSPATPGGGCR